MNRAYNYKGGGKPGETNTSTATLRHVATRTMLPQSKGGVSKYARGRRGFKLVTPVTQLTLGFPGWYVAGNLSPVNTNQELGAGGAITYAASVEYPAGTFSQVLFSGAALGTCADLGELFGVVNVTIPADTMFWVHTRFDCPAGFALFSGNGGNATNPNCNVSLADWGDKGESSGTALTDITMTGVGYNTTAGSIGGSGSGLGPHLVLAVTNKPAVINYGASSDFGETAVVTATMGSVGQVMQSLERGKIAHVNAGIRGDTFEAFMTNSTRRVAMMAYFQYAVFGGPVNDLSAGRTAAQVLGYLQSTWALFSGTRLIQVLPAPIATGASGQTVNTAVNTQRVALRASLLGSQPALYARYDVGIQLEGTTDSGIWSQTVALTNAGINPNTAGYQKIVDSGVIDVTILKPY